MNRANAIPLAIALIVAAIIGGMIWMETADMMERQSEWCQDHGGELSAHNEIIYCDLPEKNVLTQDVEDAGYPENASQVEHTNFENHSPYQFGWQTALITFAFAISGALIFGVVARQRS